MTRFIAAFLLCIAPLFPDTGEAQTSAAYANGCDGTILFECGKLASKYREPSWLPPPFPNDPARADALVRTAIDAAIAGCSGANFDLCFILSDMLLRFETPPDDPRYTPKGRMEVYIAGTEAGCAAGNPTACYWRSVAYRPFMVEIYDIGIATKMAGGLGRDAAALEIEREKTAFENRARAAAQAALPAARAACTPSTPDACAELAMLLAEFLLGEDPFEHIPLLANSCTSDHPRICARLSGGLPSLSSIRENKTSALEAHAKAITILRSGCLNGDGAKCEALIRSADPADTLNAQALKQRACELGQPKPCLSLAQSSLLDYKDDASADDLAKASDLLTRACDLGSDTACHTLEHLSKG